MSNSNGRPSRPNLGSGQIQLPPGPPDPPIIGKAIQYVRHPIELLQETAHYGDLATMSVKPWLIYLVNHPDLVKEVLVTNHLRIGRWRNVKAFKHLMGEGLVTSDNPLHLRQRRMMQPQFHRAMIEGYSSTMTRYATEFSQGWQHGSDVDIYEEMRSLTLKIVVKTLFSIDLPSEVLRLGKAFELSNHYITRRFNQYERMSALFHALPLPFTIRFKRELSYLDRLVYDLIDKRRREGDDSGDLLSLMLQASDEAQDGRGEDRMTDRQVRDETVTMFAVGHETVTVALTWAWYLLSIHPDLQARFHNELDEVLEGRPPTLDNLGELQYTEQVITEAMRLYPPIWRTGRVVTQPFDLAGYEIPRGALLCIAPIITHRDPRWFDAPGEFQPERWTSEFRDRLPRFAYYPFGGGPRLCIGEGFAWMEMKLVMAVLGQLWRVTSDPKRRVELNPLVSLRPKNRLNLRLERR